MHTSSPSPFHQHRCRINAICIQHNTRVGLREHVEALGWKYQLYRYAFFVDQYVVFRRFSRINMKNIKTYIKQNLCHVELFEIFYIQYDDNIYLFISTFNVFMRKSL